MGIPTIVRSWSFRCTMVCLAALAVGVVCASGCKDRTAKGADHMVRTKNRAVDARSAEGSIALILAVEATGSSTVGEDMHPAVVAAIPVLIKMVRDRIGTGVGNIAPDRKKIAP